MPISQWILNLKLIIFWAQLWDIASDWMSKPSIWQLAVQIDPGTVHESNLSMIKEFF